MRRQRQSRSLWKHCDWGELPIPTGLTGRPARLSVDIEPELRNKIKAAAASRGQSVPDFVAGALDRVLPEDASDRALSDLSSKSFPRDWDSDADAICDQLSTR